MLLSVLDCSPPEAGTVGRHCGPLHLFGLDGIHSAGQNDTQTTECSFHSHLVLYLLEQPLFPSILSGPLVLEQGEAELSTALQVRDG